MCIAVATYVLAPAWSVLIAATAVLIAGAGFVDVGVNAYASHAGSVRHLGLLHSAYGIGTLRGPLLAAGVLVVAAPWMVVYVVLLAIELPLLLALVRARSGWPRVADAVDAVANGRSRAPRREMWPALVVFFVYVGTEIGIGQWAYTSLTEGRGLATAEAGLAVAGHFGGILTGRLLVAAAGDRIGATTLVRSGLVLALAGAVLLSLWIDAVIGCVGLAIIGVGLAPVFPLLVALTPSGTAAQAAQGVGLRFAAGALGACTLPSAAGLLLQHVALTALGPAALGVIGALLVFHVVLPTAETS